MCSLSGALTPMHNKISLSVSQFCEILLSLMSQLQSYSFKPACNSQIKRRTALGKPKKVSCHAPFHHPEAPQRRWKVAKNQCTISLWKWMRKKKQNTMKQYPCIPVGDFAFDDSLGWFRLRAPSFFFVNNSTKENSQNSFVGGMLSKLSTFSKVCRAWH